MEPITGIGKGLSVVGAPLRQRSGRWAQPPPSPQPSPIPSCRGKLPPAHVGQPRHARGVRHARTVRTLGGAEYRILVSYPGIVSSPGYSARVWRPGILQMQGGCLLVRTCAHDSAGSASPSPRRLRPRPHPRPRQHAACGRQRSSCQGGKRKPTEFWRITKRTRKSWYPDTRVHGTRVHKQVNIFAIVAP